MAGSSLDLPSGAKSFTLQLPERPRGLAWPWALRGWNSKLQPGQVALMNGKCDRIACPFRDTGWGKPGREKSAWRFGTGFAESCCRCKSSSEGGQRWWWSRIWTQICCPWIHDIGDRTAEGRTEPPRKCAGHEASGHCSPLTLHGAPRAGSPLTTRLPPRL